MVRLIVYISSIIFFGNSLITTNTAAQNRTDTTPIEIEQYIDFQCPPCRKHYTMMQELKEDFGDRVTITSLHFPLKGHPYAQIAARASEAARNQGKYAEMEQLLYQNQSKWAIPQVQDSLIAYARKLDLDTEQFKADLVSTEIYKKVYNQKIEGTSRGVFATPTIFIEGEKVPVSNKKDELKAVIDKYLNGKSNDRN